MTARDGVSVDHAHLVGRYRRGQADASPVDGAQRGPDDIRRVCFSTQCVDAGENRTKKTVSLGGGPRTLVQIWSSLAVGLAPIARPTCPQNGAIRSGYLSHRWRERGEIDVGRDMPEEFRVEHRLRPAARNVSEPMGFKAHGD